MRVCPHSFQLFGTTVRNISAAVQQHQVLVLLKTVVSIVLLSYFEKTVRGYQRSMYKQCGLCHCPSSRILLLLLLVLWCCARRRVKLVVDLMTSSAGRASVVTHIISVILCPSKTIFIPPWLSPASDTQVILGRASASLNVERKSVSDDRSTKSSIVLLVQYR